MSDPTIVELAREVLGGDDASDDRFLDFFEARATAQALARAVVAVADLADAMDESVKKPGGIGIYTAARTMYARNIRKTLNGDNT